MDEKNMDERLDSPLIVHKKSDASYQETASEVAMNSTHTDEESADGATLERHRFKKEKKHRKWPFILLVLIVIAVGVLCALKYSGVLDASNRETTTEQPSTSGYVTQPENKFEGVIVVKGTYIFFEGNEVDGIEGLEKEIKYLDAGTTFEIWEEQSDSNFLNFEVLALLSQYDIKYEITHKVSTGLVSKYENVTTEPVSSVPSTTAASAENGND
ncbi:MAG: hypothetical protein K2H13_00435 [Eubacterium sp.]|nr:hypothetical protein [Eubacterium sp.]